MMIREVHEDVNGGYRIGESDWYEAFTDDKGELFRDCQREHGRCNSKVYTEILNVPSDVEPRTETNRPGTTYSRQSGWHFEKRKEYEGSHDTYLHGTWVTWKE
jgi:hypothetical protein